MRKCTRSLWAREADVPIRVARRSGIGEGQIERRLQAEELPGVPSRNGSAKLKKNSESVAEILKYHPYPEKEKSNLTDTHEVRMQVHQGQQLVLLL